MNEKFKKAVRYAKTIHHKKHKRDAVLILLSKIKDAIRN